MSFGDRLTKARERRDYSQAHLAKVSGIEQCQLSHYERDNREPSCENIRKLAKALDVSADYLLELRDDTARITS